MKLIGLTRGVVQKGKRYLSSRSYSRFDGNLGGGYDRIYHIHNRKTAGTSVNTAFLTAMTDVEDVYRNLVQSNDKVFVADGMPFVGWNRWLINRGAFCYAFSHIPYHQLSLPENTFSFTVLRDPVDRVLSHYNMLHSMSHDNPHHESYKAERNLLGNSLSDFVDRLPREHLENQLFMFDTDFDVDAALSRLAEVSLVCFVDDLNHLVKSVKETFGWELNLGHVRRSAKRPRPTEAELHRLQAGTHNEAMFYKMAKGKFGGRMASLKS